MHEAALAASLANMVAEEAAAAGAAEVARVIVEIGALSCVDPQALAFAFDAAKAGGPAAKARLEFVSTPGQAWCFACAVQVEIAARGDPCPECGSFQLLVQGGEALTLKSLEVA